VLYLQHYRQVLIREVCRKLEIDLTAAVPPTCRHLPPRPCNPNFHPPSCAIYLLYGISALRWQSLHAASLAYFLTATFAGVFFHGLLLSTGNIFVPMVAHAVYDAIALVRYHVKARQGKREAWRDLQALHEMRCLSFSMFRSLSTPMQRNLSEYLSTSCWTPELFLNPARAVF